MTNDIIVVKSKSPLAFKHCFNILKEQITEFNLVFTEKGISIQQTNVVKNIDIDIFLPANNFEEYTYNAQTSEVVIGINIISIFKILKIVSIKDSGICLRITEYELGISNTMCQDLFIEIISACHKQNSKTKCEKLDVNRITFDHFDTSDYKIIDIKSQDFQEIISKLKNLGNKSSKEQTVDIYYQNNTLSFIIDEQEFGYTEINKECNTCSDSKEMYLVSVKLYKLMDLMRCTSLTNYVLIYLSNDKPLIIKYAVGTLGDMFIKLN